jgi:hypothetical protein
MSMKQQCPNCGISYKALELIKCSQCGYDPRQKGGDLCEQTSSSN